jgi:hypothetical protein
LSANEDLRRAVPATITYDPPKRPGIAECGGGADETSKPAVAQHIERPRDGTTPDDFKL